MVEAIAYRYRCGIAWRDLPEAFGLWQTVWIWHRRLAREGLWGQIHARLPARADAVGKIDWPLSVDSTIARGVSARDEHHPHHRGLHRTTRTPGLSPPIMASAAPAAACRPSFTTSSTGEASRSSSSSAPGQSGDAPALIPLLEQLRVARPKGRPRTRPDAVRGDKAYSSRAIREHLRTRGIRAVFPQPPDRIGHRLCRVSAGGRPPAFNASDYRGRNVIERRFAHLKQ